jgi:hypothetical protein
VYKEMAIGVVLEKRGDLCVRTSLKRAKYSDACSSIFNLLWF